ncbi:MAG TPA: 50S ribosomal protein L21 [Candidatus Krumholzibacteriaceae bacterium]|nr:50S ribosomal protein L21 [Candidatus Krumholzibacteriaceae bacterium]
MYAVVNIAGKQIKVEKESNVHVPLIDMEVGSTVTCDDVLFYSDDDDIRVGKPYLDGIKVTAEILEHGRDEKIVVFKMKRRKKYRRKRGHHQKYTLLRIKDISA